MLKLFQSKNAQIKSAAPAVATPTATATGSAPSAANPDAAAAVKSVLAAFAEEATADAQKIAAIGQKLMETQSHLLNNAAPQNAPAANARAREEIKTILGELHAFHGECKATATQLHTMSR